MEQTEEHKREIRHERERRYAAEHRCINCGKQDPRTLSGHRYCKRCRDRRLRRERERNQAKRQYAPHRPDKPAAGLPACPYMHGGELGCLTCTRPTCMMDGDGRHGT